MDERFEKLKRELFMGGIDDIEDFWGYEIDPDEDNDVIDRRMDMVYEQMPPEELGNFFEKHGIGEPEKIQVAIESTDDYSNSEFHSRLVDWDVQNEDGSYGRMVDYYRVVAINEAGRIDKLDDRVFESAAEARATALGDSRLELVSYDDLVHIAAQGLRKARVADVLASAFERAAENEKGRSGRDVGHKMEQWL